MFHFLRRQPDPHRRPRRALDLVELHHGQGAAGLQDPVGLSQSALGQGEFRQVVEHRGQQADVDTVIAQGNELADVRQQRPDIPAAGGRGPLFQGLDSRGPQVQGHDHPVRADDFGHRQGIIAGAAAQVQEGDAR